MRSFKMFGVLVAAVALCAIGAATASAATFTASSAGAIHGSAINEQVFTTNAGTVKCKKVDVAATAATSSTSQKATVTYTECTAFGFVTVDISPAEYEFTSDGTVHVLNTITITVTKGLFNNECTVTVGAQTPTTNVVDYTNNNGMIDVTSTVGGIHYSVAGGGVCGTNGNYTNGTYTGGVTTTHSTAGQTLTFDP